MKIRITFTCEISALTDAELIAAELEMGFDNVDLLDWQEVRP
jgi:hypothetical protein